MIQRSHPIGTLFVQYYIRYCCYIRYCKDTPLNASMNDHTYFLKMCPITKCNKYEKYVHKYSVLKWSYIILFRICRNSHSGAYFKKNSFCTKFSRNRQYKLRQVNKRGVQRPPYGQPLCNSYVKGGYVDPDVLLFYTNT